MWRFFYGLLIGMVVMRLALWVYEGQPSAGWYVWPLLAVLVLLTGLTVQHFFASLKEQEHRAAWRGLLVMGVPTLILASVVVWLSLPR